MARLVGVDLPREKRLEIALTYIYGIGRSRADEILALDDEQPLLLPLRSARERADAPQARIPRAADDLHR